MEIPLKTTYSYIAFTFMLVAMLFTEDFLATEVHTHIPHF
jgi:hypothetical protein